MEETEKTLKIFWKKGDGGIRYINDGEEISFRQAEGKARGKEYAEISLDWRGMVPLDIYEEMKSRLSFLERISSQE